MSIQSREFSGLSKVLAQNLEILLKADAAPSMPWDDAEPDAEGEKRAPYQRATVLNQDGSEWVVLVLQQKPPTNEDSHIVFDMDSKARELIAKAREEKKTRSRKPKESTEAKAAEGEEEDDGDDAGAEQAPAERKRSGGGRRGRK